MHQNAQKGQLRKTMKNNLKNIAINTTLCLLILLADTGLCLAEPVTAGSSVLPIKTVIIKFLITMAAVLVSLVVLFFALIAYKKYTINSINEYKKNSLYGDNFNTPQTMDDAVISFINKNKL